MHIANQASKPTASSVINFATETKTSLAALIATFAAAEREVGEAADAEDAIPYKPAGIKVRGGMTPASVLAVEGQAPVTIPTSEWFYRSREDIERDYQIKLAKAAPAELAELDERFATLLRECDAQIEANKRAIPKGKRAADRRLAKAHRALTSAEDDIINFEPASVSEAVALLEYASRSSRSCFMPDEHAFRTIMRNAAAAIRAAQ
jgi:hypothetical protein